ncbi:ATP-grasp fold amidoligase family protein [Entomospira entomophila]|uniref:Uncharacterized protein n=1 Tax=Entomospira entomophila TaxID=2719988 RepID=A0A968GB09_9SPIO|nr:ATP-grasp fold amidoligase family protein [Entomospira entomophilus]NIZ40091.1 hypothetical protein [Entomospira entomophilus]WDI35652.1 ATP-grasp fold amidoligase family protein [Entomospira entomophilus]
MKKLIKSTLKKLLPPLIRRQLRRIYSFPHNYKHHNFNELPSFIHYHLAQKIVPSALLNKKHFHPSAVYSIQGYKQNFGRYPNFENPKLFSEKVMKRIHTTCQTSDLYPLLADKYRVREYVSKFLGSDKYLIPLIDHFATTQEFITAYQAEPAKYANTVVKVNHGSGQNFFIGKNELSPQELDALEAKLAHWLKKPNTDSFEMHYARITPHITVEQHLDDGIALVDYKFHMFKQRDESFLYVLQIVTDILEGDSKKSLYFYINQYEKPYLIKSPKINPYFNTTLIKHSLDKMIELSKKLMYNLDYARIDWYYIDQKIYFGEITLTPMAGLWLTYLGDSLDQQLGEMWYYNP